VGGGSRVIAVAIAAAVALLVGFQIGRWMERASAPIGGAGAGAGATHSHTVAAGPGSEVGGLSLSAAGYVLVPETTSLRAGVPGTVRFRVRGPDGAPVTKFAVVNESRLHLLIVRRDLSGYQHLHPSLGEDGVWSTPLTLAGAGAWRAVADFAVVGANGAQTAFTLGVDLIVAGAYTPQALPDPARESVVGGLTVTYEGTPQRGSTAPLTMRVFRDGAPVAGLEPYLGTLGHLVVFRLGDIGYLHVHADPPMSTSQVRFWLTAPSPGTYRMFFDFKLDGRVRTAAFTVVVT
jgi:hypothetical protein